MAEEIKDNTTEAVTPIREKFGLVEMDFTRYPGVDLYCDGAVEDEILSIVKELAPVEYAGAIEEHKNWPVLYHMSPLRENIVDWIPMDKTSKVLEVGSGCGAITGAFARKAGSVTCVDLSKKRSTINAYRHGECENVTIHVGNFKDIEPDLPADYDYICLIGVFEYGISYIGGDAPFETFLQILMTHLAPGGRIVIAIENKLGLKYFAGCKEDHLGTWFSGIENYANGGGVRTFSRSGLENIFLRCGVTNYHFYYPYPDYKFMTTVYSDDYLPGKGELCNNLRNFDRDRMLLFDEKHAFDGIVEDGLFPVFSNSFVAVLGEPLPVKFAKYSNDRAPEFSIRTEIDRFTRQELIEPEEEFDENGEPNEPQVITYDVAVVRKYPACEEAKNHIRGMEVAYRQLSERYAGSKLEINRCQLVEEGDELYAEFEYVPGVPLTQLLDACVERNDTEGFKALFNEYLERIGYNSEYPVSNYDLIFSNILVDGDTWTMIDYEWTFGKAIEARESAFRAIYCYLLEDEKRNAIDMDSILASLDITESDAENYREQEANFQSFVTGKRLSMGEMRNLIGKEVLEPIKWLDKMHGSDDILRVQVYEDKGQGFVEAESYFVKDAFISETMIETELAVDGNVRVLRIDPCFDSCVVRILELTFNGQPVDYTNKKILKINGRIAKPSTLIFPTVDPNINIYLTELERKGENTLNIKLEVARVPLAMTEEMAKSVKRIF